MTNVTLPSTLDYINYGAFAECNGLTEITIPNGVIAIRGQAFQNCASLTQIVLPVSLHEIGWSAFAWDEALTDVTIYAGVTQDVFSYDAFNGCSSDMTIHGVAGSYAETYASDHGFNFAALDVCADGNHHYDDGVITTPPYVFHEGVMTFTCEYCGEYYTQPIPVRPMSEVSKPIQLDAVVAEPLPDASLDSIIYSFTPEITDRYRLESFYDEEAYWCPECWLYDEDQNEIGYSWSGSKSENEFHIEYVLEAGRTYYFYVGTAFGGYYGQSKVLLSQIHENNGYDTTIEPTCTESGKATATCIHCGETYEMTLDPYGHDWDYENPEIIVEGDCETEGQKRYTCRRCGETYDEIIPAGHDYVDGVCTRCGQVEIYEGTVLDDNGNEISWIINGQEKTLTISGTGAIPDYNNPWTEEVRQIRYETIIIEDGITRIGEYAFNGSGIAKEVHIPATVTSIAYSAFDNCNALQSFEVNNANENYASIDGVLFDKSMTTLLLYPDGRQGDYTIPDGTTAIRYAAFQDAQGLSGITFPGGLTEIGTDAFRNCDVLTEVTLPDGLATLGSSSFAYCDGLVTATVPSTLSNVAEYAFQGCQNLQIVTMLSGVESISGYAFAGVDGLSYDVYGNPAAISGRLADVNLPDSISSIADTAFNGNESATIHYCSEDSYAYQYAVEHGFNVAQHTWGPWEIVKVATEETEGTRKHTCMLCGTEETQSYVIPQGACGENVTWKLVRGVLTFTGTGAMDDWLVFEGDKPSFLPERPWDEWADEITSVVVGPGITNIGRRSLADLPNLSAITLPDTLEMVGWEAFAGDTSLHSIQLPASLQTMEFGAFEGSGLTSITIPNGITKIENSVFIGCNDLESVVLSNTLTAIGAEAFAYCGSLSHIDIPESVTSIGEAAFLATGLTEVTLPDQVNDIGMHAFGYQDRHWSHDEMAWDVTKTEGFVIHGYTNSAAEYYALENEITFDSIGVITAGGSCGDDMTWSFDHGVLTITGTGEMTWFDYGQIPWSGFREHITGIVIEEGVTSICGNAFAFCPKLTSVSLPTTLLTIGNDSFFNSNKLSSVELPPNLTSIGDSAFVGTGLTEITIPASVNYIGECAVGYSQNDWEWNEETQRPDIHVMTKTEGFVIHGYTNSVAEYYALENEITFDSIGEITASGSCGDDMTWSFDHGVLTITGTGEMIWFDYDQIPWSGFKNYITDIVIGEGVTSTCGDAFAFCPKLTNVSLPTTLLGIGGNAFRDCAMLTAVELPPNLASIGYSAFVGTGLTEITIPASVNYIGECAVGYSANHYENWDEETHTGDLVQNKVEGFVIRGYTNSAAEYYALENEIAFDPIGEITASGSCGDDMAWSFDHGVLTITGTGDMALFMPDQIPWSGFENYISDIVIEEGVTSICGIAFASCPKLSSVSLPTTLLRIGDNAFRNCARLTAVELPPNLASIGDSAFVGTGLTEITIPASVNYIGECAVGYSQNNWEWNEETQRPDIHVMTKTEGFVIYGYSGTAAETYANENGFAFVSPSSVLEPEITATASADAVTAGTNVSISVETVNTIGELTYKWQRSLDGETWSKTILSGYATDTLSFKGDATKLEYMYRCEVADANGTWYSNPVKIDLLSEAAEVIATASADAVTAGTNVSISVETVNTTGELTYKWQRSLDGENWIKTVLDGYDTDTLSFKARESVVSYMYRCEVTDANGTWYSNPVKIDLLPEIIATASENAVTAGTNVSISVETVNTIGELTYKWQRSLDGETWSKTILSGYATDTLSFKGDATKLEYMYRCEVADANGTWYSNPVKIDLLSEAAEVIATASADAVTAGTNVSISVETVNTTGELTYKWQRSLDGENWIKTVLDGYDTDTLSFKARESVVSYMYRCEVTDANGTWYSNPVKIDLRAEAVEVIATASDDAVTEGTNVSISVETSNTTGELTYKWQRSLDGETWIKTILSGYDTDTLSFKGSAAKLEYMYRCEVKDARGTWYSNPVKIDLRAEAVEVIATASDDAVTEGTNVSISVETSNTTGELTYKWQRSLDGETWIKTILSGYDTDTLSFKGSAAKLEYMYRCEVKDARGTWYSNPVKIDLLQ